MTRPAWTRPNTSCATGCRSRSSCSPAIRSSNSPCGESSAGSTIICSSRSIRASCARSLSGWPRIWTAAFSSRPRKSPPPSRSPTRRKRFGAAAASSATIPGPRQCWSCIPSATALSAAWSRSKSICAPWAVCWTWGPTRPSTSRSSSAMSGRAGGWCTPMNTIISTTRRKRSRSARSPWRTARIPAFTT